MRRINPLNWTYAKEAKSAGEDEKLTFYPCDMCSQIGVEVKLFHNMQSGQHIAICFACAVDVDEKEGSVWYNCSGECRWIK